MKEIVSEIMNCILDNKNIPNILTEYAFIQNNS